MRRSDNNIHIVYNIIHNIITFHLSEYPIYETRAPPRGMMKRDGYSGGTRVYYSLLSIKKKKKKPLRVQMDRSGLTSVFIILLYTHTYNDNIMLTSVLAALGR